MNHNYPPHIIRILRKAEGLDRQDSSRDDEFQDTYPETVFETVLQYEGIIGYVYTILGWIEDIFKVKLIVDGQEQSIEDFRQGLCNILEAQELNDVAIQHIADEISSKIKESR